VEEVGSGLETGTETGSMGLDSVPERRESMKVWSQAWIWPQRATRRMRTGVGTEVMDHLDRGQCRILTRRRAAKDKDGYFSQLGQRTFSAEATSTCSWLQDYKKEDFTGGMISAGSMQSTGRETQRD